MRHRRGAQRDRGSVVMEFAFVAPILFGLLFGMFELGISVLGRAAGGNAAREGARVGVVDYVDADDDDGSPSATYVAIRDAARSKLAGGVRNPSAVVVDVRCVDYDLIQSGSANPYLADCSEDLVEEGSDMIEVSVFWEPAAATGLFTTGTRTDRARMTIVGRPPTGSVSGGPSLPTITFTCSATSFNEGDSNQTLTCTAERSSTSTDLEVTYRVIGGTAVAGSDYSATDPGTLTYGVGTSTASFTVTIIGDTVYESPTDEQFEVSIVAGSFNVTPQSAYTITITDNDPEDSTPPMYSVSYLRDVDANGKVDQVEVVMSEVRGSACSSTTAGWTLSGLPSGYTQGTVTASGSGVVIAINSTGGAALHTIVGTIRVSYSGGGGSPYCDAFGNNAAPFGAQVPLDRAGAVLSTWTSGGNRKPAAGDNLNFVFTEPVQVPSGTPSVQITREAGNNKKSILSVAPLMATATTTPNNNQWLCPCTGNPPAKTSNWTATMTPASGMAQAITVRLVACSGTCTFTAGTNNMTLPFTPMPSMVDAAGNPPASRSVPNANIF